MKLDSRILEGKKPLNCFDTEQAKQFIGKKCYFSDDARDFMDLDKADGDTLFYVAELQNIWTAEEYCFADNSNDWRYILPLEWVTEEKTEPEPKYRPYTMSEFKSEFKINIILTLRKRNEDKYVYQTVYLGNRHYDDTDSDENFIYLSHGTYSLKELFEKFEIVRNGDWQPFGIIDESQE